MIINKAALDGIQTSFKAIAMQSFEAAPTMDLTGIVDDMPMTTGKLSLSWVATLGRMREWLGSRKVRDVIAKNFEIIAKHYEHTVGVDRDDIEDDQIGQYAPQISKISAGAVRFFDEKVAEALDLAFTTLVCYDGQPLCDDSHPAFGTFAAFDNKITTALTADATGYAAVLTALGMIAGFKDGEGRNLGLSGDTLVVPSALQYVANTLTKSQFKVGTTADYNELSGLKVVVLPFLTDATNWFVVDSKSLVAPLIRGRRKEPEFTQMDDPTNPHVFMNKEFLYGVDARLDVCAGFPQSIVGSIQ